ncbi:MAG: hypothetical protein KGQ86_02615 [Bacteroidetes bacterium]|nr:hypothetical protein [Bacteroidota bacterium]
MLSFPGFSPVRYASAKRSVKSNPQNPVNPDSEPDVQVNYPLGIVLGNYPFIPLPSPRHHFPNV